MGAGSGGPPPRGHLGGRPPAADPPGGARLGRLVAALVADRVVAGIHDCSDGGLAVALAEMAIGGQCGFAARPAGTLAGLHPAAVCFSESSGPAVVAVEPAPVEEGLAPAEQA